MTRHFWLVMRVLNLDTPFESLLELLVVYCVTLQLLPVILNCSLVVLVLVDPSEYLLTLFSEYPKEFVVSRPE